MWEEKCSLLYSNISFRSGDIQVFKHSDDVIHSTKFWPNMMKTDIWANFSQKCLICTPQYEHNSQVTMATYWVPDLPNIKGISGHLWCSILICANDASYARFSRHIMMLGTDHYKSDGGGGEFSACTNFFFSDKYCFFVSEISIHYLFCV